MKNILFIASECVPFIKTGGLADVVGSLPKYFDKKEFDVRVMIPKYACIPEEWKSKMNYVTHFYIDLAWRKQYVGILEMEYEGVKFYFVDNEFYFAGMQPYGNIHEDIEKFAFFCKASLSALPSLDFHPDIIHCHDWQTGLVPVYLKDMFSENPFYLSIKTIMTIHNLKFQGVWDLQKVKDITGLKSYFFTSDKLEAYGDANYLKGGIVYADMVTTVSESYAEEIKMPFYGEHLDGFVFTQNGWVQSYGSRCVKPPVVIGDVSRPHPITVEWAKYAQSLTDKPVKGMLTGPVTILCWSFPREDVTRETIAKQIALALRDEVADLEAAGIGIIQIDEPALREGLPLRRSDWDAYLQWGVEAFRLNAAVAKDDTQIHTHMCYCEFNDIMDSIAALDADVITIETSRSDMELLESFEEFDYPNEIGPGVYDIHSPNVPSVEWIEALLKKAAQRIPAERLWVNPDCGLKTRGWPETRAALANMVKAAQNLRQG